MKRKDGKKPLISLFVFVYSIEDFAQIMEMESLQGFETPQKEYDTFLVTNELFNEQNVTPTGFSGHIQQLERLSMRLNYRFLELDSKLRFLRLISNGSGVDFGELTTQTDLTNQLNKKVKNLETKLDAIKKDTRSLRKKIGRCVYQNEVRRCVEGKDKLQLELTDLDDEIEIMKLWFIENGIIQVDDDKDNKDGEWVDEIPVNLNVFQDPEYGLKKAQEFQLDLTSTKQSLQSTNEANELSTIKLAEEIDQLKSKKLKISSQINNLNTRRLSLDTKETQKLKQISHLKLTIDKFNQFL